MGNSFFFFTNVIGTVTYIVHGQHVAVLSLKLTFFRYEDAGDLEFLEAASKDGSRKGK